MDAKTADDFAFFLANQSLPNAAGVQEILVDLVDGGRAHGYVSRVSLGAGGGTIVVTQLGAMPGTADTTVRVVEIDRALVLLGTGEKRTFGRSDPRAEFDGLQSQMGALYQAGRFDEAAVLADRALGLARGPLTADPRYLAGALANAGEMRRATGRLGEAEPIVREAAELSQRVFGPSSSNTAQAMHNLGRLLLDLGRPAEAEAPLQGALGLASAGAPDGPMVAQVLRTLATAAMAQRKPGEAVPQLRRAIAILAKDAGARLDQADANMLLTNACMASGDHAGARAAAATGVSLFGAVLGPTHPTTIRASQLQKQVG